MRIRQIVCLVLLVGLVGAVFPALSEAGVVDRGAVGELGEPSVFTRVVEWVQGLFAGLAEWVAAEGATPTGHG